MEQAVDMFTREDGGVRRSVSDGEGGVDGALHNEACFGWACEQYIPRSENGDGHSLLSDIEQGRLGPSNSSGGVVYPGYLYDYDPLLSDIEQGRLSPSNSNGGVVYPGYLCDYNPLLSDIEQDRLSPSNSNGGVGYPGCLCDYYPLLSDGELIDSVHGTDALLDDDRELIDSVHGTDALLDDDRELIDSVHGTEALFNDDGELIDSVHGIEALFDENSLRDCIANNDHTRLRRYLDKVCDGLLPPYNDWVVHYAVFLNRQAMLVDILSAGYYPSPVDCKGSTPLHYACTNGFWNCIRILIFFRADIEAIDSYGRTPIFQIVSVDRDCRAWNSAYYGHGSVSEDDLILSLKILLHMGVRLDTFDIWRFTAGSVANLHTAAGRLLLCVSQRGLGATLDKSICPSLLNADILRDYYNGEDGI
jgi:hypothetical protein